jgi:hypothetical protein
MFEETQLIFIFPKMVEQSINRCSVPLYHFLLAIFNSSTVFRSALISYKSIGTEIILYNAEINISEIKKSIFCRFYLHSILS